MSNSNRIYLEKGNEKYFLTIAELDKSAHAMHEKHVQSRSILKIIKHVAGSNQTVRDKNHELKQTYSRNSGVKEPLKRSRILCDLIREAKFCCITKDFKNRDIDEFHKKIVGEYFNLAEQYASESFTRADLITNWIPVKQALILLQENGADIKSRNTIIDNMIILKSMSEKVDKVFSALKYNYISDNLIEIRDEYAKISSLSLQDEYKIFFSRMEKIVKDSYQKLTADLENKIEKEAKQKTPSASYMMKQMTAYIQIEADFEIFSSGYKPRKYDENFEELKLFISSCGEYSKVEANAIERILQIKDSLKRILEMNERFEDITKLLDKFIHNYKEVVKEKAQLVEIQNKYKSNIYSSLEELLKDPITLMKTNSNSIYAFNDWYAAYGQLLVIQAKLTPVTCLETKISKTQDNELQKMLTYLSSVNPTKETYSAFIKQAHELKQCFQTLNQRSDELRIKDRIDTISDLYKDFEDSEKKAIQASVVIKENLPLKNIEILDENANRIDEFIRIWKNSELLQYLDLKAKYISISNEFKGMKMELNKLLELSAYKGDLCLFDQQSNHRYLFIARERIEFGRQVSPGSFYKDGKVFIPWATVSGNHGYIDANSMMYFDSGSSNGSYSAKSRTRKKEIDLKKDKDLNFAMQFSFDFDSNNSFQSFKLSWLDHKQINHLLHFDSSQAFLDKWTKLNFIIPAINSSINVSKLDGSLHSEVDDPVNYHNIVLKDGKYYYSDLSNNVRDELIKKSGNSKMALLVETL